MIVADAWLPAENALELCILGAGGRAWCAPLRLNPELNEAALEADLEDAAGAMHAAAAEVRREEKEMLNTDELDVTLTFEIERQAVKLGDLKRMKAGYVMRLAADPASPVTVLANGRPVARGRKKKSAGGIPYRMRPALSLFCVSAVSYDYLRKPNALIRLR